MGEAQNVVKAKRFELVDDSGKTRLSLGIENDHASMRVMDNSANCRVSVGMDKKGVARLSLNDNHGEPRIVAMVAENGSSFVFTYDKQGVTRLQLETGSSDITRVILGGKNNKPLVGAVVGSDRGNEQGKVAVYGPDGQVLFEAP